MACCSAHTHSKQQGSCDLDCTPSWEQPAGLRMQHGPQHARQAPLCDSRSAACNNRSVQQHPPSGWRSSPCHASPPRAACPSCRLNSLLQWKASPIAQLQPCGACPLNDVRLALGVDVVCEPAVRSAAADRRSGPQNTCHGRCIGTQLVSRKEEHQPACAPPQAGKVAGRQCWRPGAARGGSCSADGQRMNAAGSRGAGCWAHPLGGSGNGGPRGAGGCLLG